MLTQFELALFLDELEMFSIITAGLSHDVGHNGYNNAFHINTSSKFAVRYNDKSVLENYHASFLISTLLNNKFNIFQSLNKNDWNRAKKLMISCILHTDMSMHFDSIEKIKSLAYRFILAENSSELVENINLEMKYIIEKNENKKSYINRDFLKDSADRDILCQSVLHSVDISNPTRMNETFIKWCSLINKEF